jgi:hypothetical protein
MTESKQKVINKQPKYLIETHKSEKIKWVFEIYNGKTLIEKMAGYHTEDIAYQTAKELIKGLK